VVIRIAVGAVASENLARYAATADFSLDALPTPTDEMAATR